MLTPSLFDVYKIPHNFAPLLTKLFFLTKHLQTNNIEIFANLINLSANFSFFVLRCEVRMESGKKNIFRRNSIWKMLPQISLNSVIFSQDFRKILPCLAENPR